MTVWAISALALAVALLAHRIGASHDHAIEHLDRKTHHLAGVIRMTAQDTVNAAVAQIKRGTSEVLGKIAELQAQVDAGVPAEELDLTALTEAAQALDDIVPDAPVEDTPVEDVPVDEPVDVPVDDEPVVE